MVQFKFSVALFLQVAIVAIALAPSPIIQVVALPTNVHATGKDVKQVGSTSAGPAAPTTTRLTIRLPA